MKYVFDISQSIRYRDVPQPYVWDLQEEYKDELILSLAGDLSISIEEAVSDFCENTVDSLLSDYQNAKKLYQTFAKTRLTACCPIIRTLFFQKQKAVMSFTDLMIQR